MTYCCNVYLCTPFALLCPLLSSIKKEHIFGFKANLDVKQIIDKLRLIYYYNNIIMVNTPNQPPKFGTKN